MKRLLAGDCGASGMTLPAGIVLWYGEDAEQLRVLLELIPAPLTVAYPEGSARCGGAGSVTASHLAGRDAAPARH